MTRRAPLLPAVSLAAGLAAASSAAAQPVAVFSAETSLVNVAVAVEDAHGRPIDGLTARDFVLSEDGRRQKIEMCARVGEGGGRSTSLDVALLVDTSDSMLATLRRSQDVAVRFLTSLPERAGDHRRLLRPDPAPGALRPGASRGAVRAGADAARGRQHGGARRDRLQPARARQSNGRSALVLLTDGIDTVSATEPAALDKAVQSHAVTIYPVAYPAAPGGDGPDPQQALKELEPARPGHGRTAVQAAERGGAARRARRDPRRPSRAVRPRLRAGRLGRARPAAEDLGEGPRPRESGRAAPGGLPAAALRRPGRHLRSRSARTEARSGARAMARDHADAPLFSRIAG